MALFGTVRRINFSHENLTNNLEEKHGNKRDNSKKSRLQ